MKKVHVIAIFLIIAAIGVMFAVAKDFDQFASFEAAQATPTKKVKINGYLSKDKPMVYNPLEDTNTFSFYMKDKKNGQEELVEYKGSKPQDFERSEELVLTGFYEEDKFIATNMLMKCPSKYKDEEIGLRENVTFN